ncbi:Lysine-specific demethylase 7A [Oryzias melastigma]|uniref:Lysine-specific demethylase 7A n=1 Tax=Oryzias melastigma TaxID=30732 RepID=A0A834FE77_ORYME|nr:Lysine-specific demethylase 7A [Oryzias melastigma]
MERRLKTPDLFKFPYFEAICWYVAKNLLEMLKELREDNCPPSTYLVDGVKALIRCTKNVVEKRGERNAARSLCGSSSDAVEPRSCEKLYSDGGNLTVLFLCSSFRRHSQQVRDVERRRERTAARPRAPHWRGFARPGGQRRAARRLREQQQQAPKLPTNLDILEQHTREVLKRLEVGPLEEDAAFCAKVHGKLNKVSTASAAAAAESLEDNHLRLMMVNGRIIRDVRRPASSPSKAEGERSSPGQSPPKSCADVKSERTQGSPERLGADVKPVLLGGLESGKTDLREDVSGHSSASDVESDSDSPTECKASSSSSSSSSEEDSESSQEEEETGSGHTIQLDQSGQKLRHNCKPLKRERPTSPSTEEAIQGMLSMAGLLCSTNPERPGSTQESWWSNSSQCSRQGGGGMMDSQGNSSSEAWDNQGFPSPEAGYQYGDPSMSPPLHPSKRHAPNPPPISNQATKGKRPKKGMATAKQRLGKILKLNRHSHVFV